MKLSEKILLAVFIAVLVPSIGATVAFAFVVNAIR